MIGDIIALACGGVVGVLLRHGVCVMTVSMLGQHFPFGILLVNVLGGLAAGVIFALFSQGILSEAARVFFIPGLLGAFTTFSAYSLDTVNLIMSGRWLAGISNIVLNNGLAILFVFVGMWLVRVTKGLG